MAELDTTGQDFGIENTMSVDPAGAGDQNLLNDLFSDDDKSVSANPDDLSAIEDGDDGGDDKKKTPPASDADDQKDKKKKTEQPPANDPTALTNWLTSEEEEEEEEEEGADGDDNDDDDNDDDAAASETKSSSSSSSGGDEEEEEEGEEEEGEIAFNSLASELADLGVFSREEGEEDGINISTPEEFLERFNLEKQKGAQEMLTNFIGQFGQEYQDAFQAIYVNGADPRQYFSQSAKVEDYSTLDLSVEKNQEQVVKEMLSDQGFEPEDIQGEVDKLKNYGDLEDVSKRYHKVLMKKQKAQLDQQAAQAQKYYENVQSTLQEKLKAKEFDGIPLNPKTANELQDFLLVDKWKTNTGDTLTDFDKAILDLKKPENHATKVKVGLLLKLLEKDPTLSTIQKRGVSKKSSQLFKDVARHKTTSKRKSSGSSKGNPTIKSWFQ